jgi:hypothetical protein
MSEIKQCHACGEEIKSIAKRCPHCQTWQSKWRLEPTDPKFFIIWIIMMVVIFSVLFLRTGFFGKKNFQDYASSLVITDSKLNYGSDSCGSFISVIGRIKNNSDVTWEHIHFEVQFYNSDKKLIDTISDSNYDLVVLPHSESAFKARGKADNNKDAYQNYKILIKKAKESEKWF